MRATIVAALLAALLNPAFADAVHVLDGDTVDIGGERIRLLGIDAPESWKSRCAAEAAVAGQATNRLRQLLAAGPITIRRAGFDRYGRRLADVFVGGADVGEMLVAEGLAVRWQPGRAAWSARARHWCPNWSE